MPICLHRLAPAWLSGIVVEKSFADQIKRVLSHPCCDTHSLFPHCVTMAHYTEEDAMELADLKVPELPSAACPYAFSVLGALIRMSQASEPLVHIATEDSSHDFVKRLVIVSSRTRTHFPRKKAERSMDADEKQINSSSSLISCTQFQRCLQSGFFHH